MILIDQSLSLGQEGVLQIGQKGFLFMSFKELSLFHESLTRALPQGQGTSPAHETHSSPVYGSKPKNHQGTTGFGPCFHLPGFHLGYLFLTHSHLRKALIQPYPKGLVGLETSASTRPTPVASRTCAPRMQLVSGRWPTSTVVSQNNNPPNRLLFAFA